MIDPVKLGSAIKDLRTKLGIRRPDSATKTGVTPNYFGMLEAGKRMPSIEMVQKIAMLFGVPEELLICLGSSLPKNSPYQDILRTAQEETLKVFGAKVTG